MNSPQASRHLLAGARRACAILISALRQKIRARYKVTARTLTGAGMRYTGWTAVAAATVMGFSVAAVAQDNPYGGGTRLTGPKRAEIPTGPKSAEDKARVATQQLAGCLIKLHRGSVVKALQEEPWQDGAEKMLRSVVDDRCLEAGELAIPVSLMRGAYYQQLYRQTYTSAPPPLPATFGDFGVTNVAGLPDEAKAEIAIRQFGDCVARSDPNDAHAFIISAPGSRSEDTALNALVPHLGGCLTKGSSWTMNRSSLAAVLSEVLYREGAASLTIAK
jgi:hypothetical protein